MDDMRLKNASAKRARSRVCRGACWPTATGISRSGSGQPANKLTDYIFFCEVIRLEEKTRMCCLDCAEVRLP